MIYATQQNQPTGYLLRQYLDQENLTKIPTCEVLAVTPVAMHSQPFPPLTDRPFLKVTNPDMDTLSLVNEALYRFYQYYPERQAEIVLGTALRYLEMWVSHSAVLNYAYQSGDYDVMIRSL